MSKFFLSCFIVLALFAAIALVASQHQSRTVLAPSLTIHGHLIHLEEVATEAERERGLGGRASLANDHGMLFLFDQSGVYPFWMKDMQFALDIVWIDHGRVVDIATLPPPHAGEAPAIHQPAHAADRVLEINAGQAQADGLMVGDSLNVP